MHFFAKLIPTAPVWALWACAWAFHAFAQGPAVMPPGVAASASASTASAANKPIAPTRPNWSELSASEQQALAPLKTQWQTISAAQKRKWLALAKNFATLSGEDRVKLHSRVQEWAQLSPQQRTQARLNFAETAQHTTDEKRAKWEAYQALSVEEKNKLAAASTAAPTGAATAVKKVPPHKLAASPALKAPNMKGPKIDVEMLDPATLLPQAPQTAAAPTVSSQSE
ncbi:MAG: DUF3106 domain-containing protein [Betaproteobacteria bacterium]|nr:DUF3106 domain-containing protein [Betaproteobacteria bacterium]